MNFANYSAQYSEVTELMNAKEATSEQMTKLNPILEKEFGKLDCVLISQKGFVFEQANDGEVYTLGAIDRAYNFYPKAR